MNRYERMTPEQLARERAQLGIEAEAFRFTALGQYLFERADLEEAELIRKLLDTNPRNIDKCQDIRNDIRVVEMFRQYLLEIESSGQQAVLQLMEMDAIENMGPVHPASAEAEVATED